MRMLLQELVTHVLAWASSLSIRSEDRLLARELARCGEIIDPHLHIAPWFNTAAPLVAELASANISIGLLYNPYPKMALPFDLNTYIHGIAEQSGGHIYALASLNTTHDVWEDHREVELERLATFLTKDHVLGTKLAPPHTCLSLTGKPLDDIVDTVHRSDRAKVIAIHIGTTPFCGPLGEQFNLVMCCQRDYVDPDLLVPKFKAYPDITFILLHAGHEFLPPESPYYYNFEFVNKSIALAATYPNVWSSLSAMFAQNEDAEKTMKYPGGLDNTIQFKQANVTHKLLWGSDASYYPGQIRPVLIQSIKAMIQAKMTPDERCWTLSGAARHVFAIPNATTPTTSCSSSSGTMEAGQCTATAT